MDIRHPLAAVLGVVGIVIGAVAAVGGPATAADNELTGTVTFSCQVSTFTPYDWSPTITLTALRPEGSDQVTVSATMSQMAGVSPVPLTDAPFTNDLALSIGGTAVHAKGSGTVNAEGRAAFTMPSMVSLPFTSSAATLPVTVTGFSFEVTEGVTLPGTCAPTAGAALGTLTLATGTPPTQAPTPTPTPTPTTTTSATATPSASSSPTASSSTAAGAKPAKGTVDFACVLNPLNSAFEYPATISVAGYREKAGDDVSLSATMSDLPGISPVPIDGQMDVTLALTVGGAKTTLKGSTHAVAAPKAKVPVPNLSGSVAADDDELAVKVTGFTFNFAALSIDATCKASSVALSTMVVGSEPVETDDEGTDTTSGSTTTTTSSGTLPQTGGGDSLPVVGLWALALTLLGVAGLLCVPQARRKH